jgi:hypothetical protein
MKLAIMQPYVFPYIGYFHLINASDLFVFYDDVNYITRGWINRNRILLNGKDYLFTVPVSNASRNRLINETSIEIDHIWRNKFHKTLVHSDRKAPYFPQVVNIIISVFSKQYSNVSDLAITSTVSVYDYLGMQLNHTKSSACSPETKGMDNADRLIEITKRQGYKKYVNAAGGINLYSKDYFRAKGVELGFVKSDPVEYRQYTNDFVPWLSIVDVMMFNDAGTIMELFTKYKVN